jgi:ubiquinone/menaquinone biosynthesis C-methylase UbiE
VGDAEALALRHERFDAATVGFGIGNTAHPEVVLREILRVLRPGGPLVCWSSSIRAGRMTYLSFESRWRDRESSQYLIHASEWGACAEQRGRAARRPMSVGAAPRMFLLTYRVLPLLPSRRPWRRDWSEPPWAGRLPVAAFLVTDDVN